MIELDKLLAARKVAFKPLQSHVTDTMVLQFGKQDFMVECRMFWKDLGKRPSFFRVGRLQKQLHVPNELARAMSSDFSEMQTDRGKVYHVFQQFYQEIVYDFFEKFENNRQQRNSSVVYKKAKIFCFEDGKNFRFVRENAFNQR